MSLTFTYPTAKKLKKQPQQNNGLDMFDKALIGAVKFGLFAMFGLFVAAKMQKPKNVILPSVANPKPRAKPKLP